MRPELSDVVLDQVERSIGSGAGMVVLDVKENGNEFDVFLSDNGRPLEEKLLQTLKDDFQTGEKPADSVAGLLKLKDLCDRTGGRFNIDSGEENGTSLHFGFDAAKPDAPEPGDLPELFVACMMLDGDYELVVNRFYNDKKYSAVRSEIVRTFGDLNDSRSMTLLREYFDGCEEEIHGKARS